MSRLPVIKQWLSHFSYTFYLHCLKCLITSARFRLQYVSNYFCFSILPWAPTFSFQPENSKEGYSRHLFKDPRHERKKFFNDNEYCQRCTSMPNPFYWATFLSTFVKRGKKGLGQKQNSLRGPIMIFVFFHLKQI